MRTQEEGCAGESVGYAHKVVGAARLAHRNPPRQAPPPLPYVCGHAKHALSSLVSPPGPLVL